MDTCNDCGEDPGKGARCQNCGSIRYRYAFDEGTDDAVAGFAAKDAAASGEDASLEDLEELLSDLADGQPDPAPYTLHVPSPPRPTPPAPARTREPVEATSPLSSDRSGQARGCGPFVSVGVFLAFGFIVFNIVANPASAGEFEVRRLILPALLLFAIARRFGKNRRR